jgi:hypothetical protein
MEPGCDSGARALQYLTPPAGREILKSDSKSFLGALHDRKLQSFR